MKGQIDLDWPGVITLLAKHLYSEKRIFIREIIQNAHDAVMKRRHRDPAYSSGGAIRVTVDMASGRIAFEDDGIGMTDDDLTEFLATVGRGETRLARAEVPGVIGQFGIGFLSAFIVADNGTVDTRKIDSERAWRWSNSGSRDYEILDGTRRTPGTTVSVHVPDNQRGILAESEAKEVIKTYCDMLKVPVYVGDADTPCNSMTMPWEREYESEAQRDWHFRVLLEERTPDNVLEVIPLGATSEIDIEGLLYITKARTWAQDMPRHVEVYIRRMLVSSNEPRLLPDWATFVNGVINSTALEPTAARDNIVRNAAFEATRQSLGDQILAHLSALKSSQRDRFSNILRFHHIRLLLACLLHEEFFNRFAMDLEWRVNAPSEAGSPGAPAGEQRKLLHEILEHAQPREPGGPKELLAFETGNADHFFEMGNAQGLWIVDASAPHELDVLRRCIERLPESCKLVMIDREDPPSLFRAPAGDRRAMAQLSAAMAAMIQPGGSRLDVSAKDFEPKSIPGILRRSDDDNDRDWAREVLSDPNASEAAKRVARNIIDRPPRVIRFTLNAQNLILRKVAQLDFRKEEYRRFLLGVYNSAFLVSGTMTPGNAKVLSGDFLSLLESSVDAANACAGYESKLALLESALQEKGETIPAVAQHVVVFLITPYDTRFDRVVEALRHVVEEKWSCQLLLARDEKLNDRLLDSLRLQVQSADAFIVDVTGANPNVMFELGMAATDRRSRPIALLLDSSQSL